MVVGGEIILWNAPVVHDPTVFFEIIEFVVTVSPDIPFAPSHRNPLPYRKATVKVFSAHGCLIAGVLECNRERTGFVAVRKKDFMPAAGCITTFDRFAFMPVPLR